MGCSFRIRPHIHISPVPDPDGSMGTVGLSWQV